MILGIDASNLRGGGGVTHIVEMLKAADPPAHGFSQVIVWGGRAILDKIEDRSWLVKLHVPALDRSLLHRAYWQRFKLSTFARKEGCDVLFVPGGAFAGDFRLAVTMSRNLLPFELRELIRFGWSWMAFKLVLLRITQIRTFRRVAGLVFLTRYARDVVKQAVKNIPGKNCIVSHGIDGRFFCPPREQFAISHYSTERPFRILYVSIIDMYKHQWHVAEAVAQLRASGLPVLLSLVGPSYPAALKRLNRTLDLIDPDAKVVRYLGRIPHDQLHLEYMEADLCLFASSCENMPNILLEGMASGLPIACSDRGPMPELLGNTGMYFNPEKPHDIARCLRELIASPALRMEKAKASFKVAHTYSWTQCAEETLEFLAKVAADVGVH
jgi:glycosyltransferase involved in cell wall biosynthesis